MSALIASDKVAAMDEVGRVMAAIANSSFRVINACP
jgi:hypothetical protein